MSEKTELTVEAVCSNLDRVTAFVDERLERLDCPIKVQMKLDIAIDEIFSNIVHYAYGEETGRVTVQLEISEEPLTVSITFMDWGIPYNPLLAAEPDISLSANERQIGGLGIFLVKKSMDDISYEHRDGANVLTIQKNITVG